MRGTQEQTHVIIIRADNADKKRQQETSDMSELAHNNFRILELFSQVKPPPTSIGAALQSTLEFQEYKMHNYIIQAA